MGRTGFGQVATFLWEGPHGARPDPGSQGSGWGTTQAGHRSFAEEGGNPRLVIQNRQRSSSKKHVRRQRIALESARVLVLNDNKEN